MKKVKHHLSEVKMEDRKDGAKRAYSRAVRHAVKLTLKGYVK